MQEEINIYNPLWYKDPNPIMLEKYLFELNHHPEYLINPQYQQEHAKYLLLYIRHTTGVFLRSLDPQKYKNLYPIERFTTKPYKNLICLEAQLWGKIWQALLNLEPEYRHSETPAKIFHHIIQEAKLVLLISCPANIDRIPSVEDFLRSHQRPNQQLKKLLNPFLQEESPYTWSFIEQIIMAASRSDRSFKKNYYNPLLKARVSFRDLLEHSKDPKTGKKLKRIGYISELSRVGEYNKRPTIRKARTKGGSENSSGKGFKT
jgi:hypothetical protein